MTALDAGRAAEAARLYLSGMTSREAGAAVGADNTTVLRWLQDMGIETRRTGPRGRTDVDGDAIVRMRDREGLSFAEIGRRTGMSRRGASNRYRAAKGISRPDRMSWMADLPIEAQRRAQGYAGRPERAPR